jgi:hypothetical protein
VIAISVAIALVLILLPLGMEEKHCKRFPAADYSCAIVSLNMQQTLQTLDFQTLLLMLLSMPKLFPLLQRRPGL